MKLGKLSLATAVAIGCLSSANAADTLVEALTNGKLSGRVQATYADVEQKTGSTKQTDADMISAQIEINYVTDPLYGFRLGLTLQGSGAPFKNDDMSKKGYNKEWYANGFVLSEAYLGYSIGNTDIKAGRQYVNTPLVMGNPTRAFKEAFQGVTIVNKDIPQTTLTGGWYDRFQGRSKVAMSADNARASASETKSGAPTFRERVIVPGAGPVALKFDNIYTLAISNESIPGLKLTGAWAKIDDVNIDNASTQKGDIDIYLAEANYKHDLDVLKLGLDAMYKGSRVSGAWDNRNLGGVGGNTLGDGDMFGARLGVYDLVGFGLSYAYTTVSDDSGIVFGVGNGPASYTFLPIRGPFVHTGYKGMDTHKIVASYKFDAIGIKGLNAALHYANGDQKSNTRATDIEVEGWGAVVNYAIPQVKGLSVQLTYVELDRTTKSTGAKENWDELWLKVGYRFDLLN